MTTKPKKRILVIHGRKTILCFSEGERQASMISYEPSDAYKEMIKRYDISIEQLRSRSPVPTDIPIKDLKHPFGHRFHYKMASRVIDTAVKVNTESIQYKKNLNSHWEKAILS